MKTEQEIKEELTFLKGYKDALYDYETVISENINEDIKKLKGQVEALEWVLENSNQNCEEKND